MPLKRFDLQSGERGYMKSFLQKNIWGVFAVVLGVCFTVLACLGLGNFGAPSTYYQTGNLDKVDYSDAVFYSVSYSDGNEMDSVWINLGGPDHSSGGNSVTFYTGFASGSSGRYSYVTKTFDNDADDMIPGGWVRLCSDVTYSTRNYLYIATKSTVKINEVAFVGKNDKGVKTLLKATPLASGGKTGLYTSFADSSEINKEDDGIALANLLIDEQNKFDVNRISDGKYNNDKRTIFTESESYTLDGIRDLYAGRGTFVDKTVNPAAQYLMGLGILIFGANTFGLRIIPLLFTLGTIPVLYFFGKMAFNKSSYGFLFALLFAVGGFSLGFATLGQADALMSFFIVCTAYSLYLFCRKGISSKKPAKGFTNLLLGGAAYSLALVTKSQALFFAPVFIGMLVFGFIRQYKAYAARKAEINSADVSGLSFCRREYVNKFTLTFAITLAGFIFLPIILISIVFLIGYPTFSTAYSNTGLFSYALKHFLSGFTAVNHTSYDAVNSLNVLGWIVNQGVEVQSADKFVFGNIIVSFLNLFSLMYCGGYLILTLIDSRGKGLDSRRKMGFAFPYLVFLSMWLFGWLLNLICTDKAVGGYYTASIFASGAAVALIYSFELEKSKKLFSIRGKEVTVFNIITFVVTVAAAVAFILAVPALTGISAPYALFTWQSLTPVVI